MGACGAALQLGGPEVLAVDDGACEDMESV